MLIKIQYREWAWNAFKAINATCRTDSGFAAVSSVNTSGGGSKYDNQESFLYAEVMKYAYLVHAEGEYLSCYHSYSQVNHFRFSLASSEGQ